MNPGLRICGCTRAGKRTHCTATNTIRVDKAQELARRAAAVVEVPMVCAEFLFGLWSALSRSNCNCVLNRCAVCCDCTDSLLIDHWLC